MILPLQSMLYLSNVYGIHIQAIDYDIVMYAIVRE